MNSIDYLKSIGINISNKQFEINSKKTVVVGMSGGVDSSVAALVLKMQGFKVIGIFMKNWDENDENGVCSSEVDYADVRAVCEQIDIPYYSVNFVEEYQDNVFSSFLEEYKQGHTPNPDILCNREIKFKVFFDKAMSLGADFLATGHYCRVVNGRLIKGNDQNKDQSYFLYAINGDVLDRVLFPIGEIEKPIVRKIAKDYNLKTASKKDSTGICFIGERNFKNFLSDYLNEQKGNFVNYETGSVIKQHDGVCFYTVGQRKGLGIGGPGGPWFVNAKDVENKIVYVVEGEDHPALYANELWACESTWIKNEPNFPLKLTAKIRYRQEDQVCLVDKVGDQIYVKFDKPQRAITLRQSIVLYDGDECLGGAIIEKAGESLFKKKTVSL